jgi:uncharacterized repeat protein (TIGR01451 family)
MGGTGGRLRALVLAVVLAVTGGVMAGISATVVSQGPAGAQTDSVGSDFWLAFPTNFDGGATQTLFIAGPTATSGTVAVPGLGSSQPFSVTPGSVTSVVLPAGTDGLGSDTVDDLGVHVTAGAEVSVYGLNAQTFTTDAFLGLPTDILGTEYIVQGYRNTNIVNATEFAVVGTQAATTVTITPSVTTGTRTAGVPYTVTLGTGDTYQLVNTDADPADLSGTVVTADKPIGVFGGHGCANIPDGSTLACDHLVEQMTPTTTWGQSFVTVPLATRTGGDTFRFLASTAATTVRVNGTVVATLGRGEIHQQLLTAASVVTSDKPILVTQYSNGTTFDGVTSDPFEVIIPPNEQFLSSYTVTTPATGFTTNFINVVAPTSAVGSVVLDGTAIPAGSFTAIPGSSFSGAQVPVALGSHALSSAQPFGITVYGFAEADSYGYPGGLSLAPVATVTSVSVTPAGGTAEVGTETCKTATVRDQNDDPVVGPRVDFAVTGANTATGFAEAGADGTAEFCYTGTNAGADTITGAVGSVSGSAGFTWTEGPGELAVSLAPATSTGPVGSGYTATATVTRGGTPEAGLSVGFVVLSGPNVGETGTGTTNAAGEATFSYTSTATGTDTIRASVSEGEAVFDSNTVTREWTAAPAGALEITSEGQPEAVTAGASALRIITVTNRGEGTAADVSLTFTLPPGTTLVSSTPSQGSCGGVVEGAVTCALGDLAGGASAEVRFVVTTPTVIPPGGSITTSASASSGEDTAGPAESSTTLLAPTPGTATGFVPPGGTLSTGTDATAADNTVASFSLPNTGPGAVITITSVPCAPGVCFGKTMTFTPFTGYDDPTNPARFTITWDRTVRGTGLLSQAYVLKEGETQFRIIPPCQELPKQVKVWDAKHKKWKWVLKELVSTIVDWLIGGRTGIAHPSPCVNRKDLLGNGDLRFETLFLSGDPSVRRR